MAFSEIKKSGGSDRTIRLIFKVHLVFMGGEV
jgi:hypothetical protein